MRSALQQVAQKAGVSLSTASMALSGKGRVSAATREKVLQAAEELNYKKTTTAIVRPPGTEPILAVLVSTDLEWSFLWDFQRRIINRMEQELFDSGFNLVMLPFQKSLSVTQLLRKIQSSGAAGVFPMHYGNADLLDNLNTLGIPGILMFNNQNLGNTPSVGVDDYQCGLEGTEFLLKRGYTHIGYIDTTMPELPNILSGRSAGLMAALNAAGHPLKDEDRIRMSRTDLASLSDELSRMIRNKKLPEAFFCLDDDLALKVIIAAQSLGLQVPEDISVIAVGDVLEYSSLGYPKISTVQIDTESAAKLACHLMIERLTGKASKARTSSGRLPGEQGGLRQEPGPRLKVGARIMTRGSCLRE